MINFIIVDDFFEITDNIHSIINKCMINNKIEYKVHIFNDYNSQFMELIKKPIPNKIYFLDIETKSASGLDIARMIRRVDIDSVLIFITAHDELSSIVAKEQLMALTFICKFDNFEKNLKTAINKSLKLVDKKKAIRFNDYNSIYTIPIKDILYITRDSIERKCIIKTDYMSYKVGKSLSEIKNLSDGELVQTHRACLINEERVQKIDKRKREIVFDNGEKIDLLSNMYKKELV